MNPASHFPADCLSIPSHPRRARPWQFARACWQSRTAIQKRHTYACNDACINIWIGTELNEGFICTSPNSRTTSTEHREQQHHPHVALRLGPGRSTSTLLVWVERRPSCGGGASCPHRQEIWLPSYGEPRSSPSTSQSPTSASPCNCCNLTWGWVSRARDRPGGGEQGVKCYVLLLPNSGTKV
jgi:hypothetical protein